MTDKIQCASLGYNCGKRGERLMTDTQQIIKAAVEAIEDIMPSSHGTERRCKNSVCHLCDILTLEPILKALKGLIDG